MVLTIEFVYFVENLSYTSAAKRRARIILIIRALEGRNVWKKSLTNGRGSRVAGKKSRVAGKKSRVE